MTSKKYIVCVVSVLYVFIAVNIVLWYGLRSIFFENDLVRMGSIDLTDPLTEDRHYPKHHTELTEYLVSGKRESFDVLTIGDSFTNGKDGGSYPDYLVNEYGLKVLNARVKNHCLTDLYILLKSGILDQIRPKVVILEAVERIVQKILGYYEFVPEYAPEFTSGDILSAKRLDSAESVSSGILPPIFVRWSMTFLRNKIYHLLNPEKLSPEVYTAKLDRPFFTNPGQENTIFFIDEDLNHLRHPLDAEMVNQNLNTAARLMKAKGITLIFFAAADKYDLYSPYITDKKGRPENPLFQKLRDVQGKEYIYVDTLTPLRQALERGEQDVYWLGDTHWSHKGIKIFCDELVKYILPELR